MRCWALRFTQVLEHQLLIAAEHLIPLRAPSGRNTCAGQGLQHLAPPGWGCSWALGHQKPACYICPATACQPAPRRCPRTLKTSPNMRGNPAIDVSLQKGLPRWKSSTSLVAVKPAVCDVAELKFLPCSAGSFFFFYCIPGDSEPIETLRHLL